MFPRHRLQEPNRGPPIHSPPLTNKTMLFNLAKDPYEKKDLSKEYPQILNALLVRSSYSPKAVNLLFEMIFRAALYSISLIPWFLGQIKILHGTNGAASVAAN